MVRSTITVPFAVGGHQSGSVSRIVMPVMLRTTGAMLSNVANLPPENATGNYVEVVQRIPVKIVFEKGQDPEHLLRPGISVEPDVRVR